MDPLAKLEYQESNEAVTLTSHPERGEGEYTMTINFNADTIDGYLHQITQDKLHHVEKFDE